MREAAPAKLNLALHVTGRRADGLHTLETLAAFTDLGDTVEVKAASRDRFAVEGPFAGALSGGGSADAPNLVERARDALRAACPDAPPVAITLQKRLPVASGIGGGSADAAATLRLLARHWNAPPATDLAAIAATLGADVPMCLQSRTLIAKGIGEVLRPADLAALSSLAVLLVNPGVPVSTPDVFRALVSRENPPLADLPPPDGSVDGLLDWLHGARNDLEAPARSLAPPIGDALRALRGADLARMSGSGATCFGLYRSPERAEEARRRIAKERPGWFAAATTFRTEGEAP